MTGISRSPLSGRRCWGLYLGIGAHIFFSRGARKFIRPGFWHSQT